jgi:transcription elongation factor Elf1
MVVKIGSMTAVCPVCGHEDFRCAEKQPSTMDVMTCADCGTKVTHGFLVQQIAQRSIDATDAVLRASKDRKHS